MTGKILILEAGLLFLPLLCALIYGEFSVALAFLATALLAGGVGFIMHTVCGDYGDLVFAKDGFAVVAFAWLLMSAFGALPFVFSGEIPNYINAFFETVSGLTTTGASIVDNVEGLSHGILFWRSFTHWLGGMGVLVFIMALVPNLSDKSVHIMRAEMPGPIFGKLVPRVKDTAKILYLIYVAVTFLEVVFLMAGRMSFFEALLHSFGTAGTGGFGLHGDSIGSYSPYIQWVIAVFMMLFGVNFNLFYLMLLRKFRSALGSRELWAYLGIILFSTAVISADIFRTCTGVEETVRTAFFQVCSLVTTTGYSTANFDTWSQLSKGIIVILMFIGGCAGSTAGGLKVSRIMLMLKMIAGEVRKMIHPRAVSVVRFEGKAVEPGTISGLTTYFSVYTLCYVAIFLLLTFNGFDFETNFTATSACFNNIGPGLSRVAPIYSFNGFSYFSKIVLSFAMLLGRLEIFPLILTFSPGIWRKN